MPPVAREQKGKIRVPQQRVRAGRGVPGYKGDKGQIEVYAVPDGRASYESQPVEDTLESKTRAQLDEIAAELGLTPGDYGNKGKIIDAINEARDAAEE